VIFIAEDSARRKCFISCASLRANPESDVHHRAENFSGKISALHVFKGSLDYSKMQRRVKNRSGSH
jgi:hypothetical protein